MKRGRREGDREGERERGEGRRRGREEGGRRGGRDGRGAVIRFFRIRTKNRTTLKRDLTNRLLVLLKKEEMKERRKETKVEKEEGKEGRKEALVSGTKGREDEREGGDANLWSLVIK